MKFKALKKDKNAADSSPSPADASRAKRTVKSWYVDRYEAVLIQRNVLVFIVLGCILSIMAGLMFAIYLNNRKTVEPFVIEISEETGIASVVEQLDVKSLTQEEAFAKYFVSKYVKLREEFDINYYNRAYYQDVRLLSAPNAFSAFRSGLRLSGKEGLLETYGTTLRRQVSLIKSIQFISLSKGAENRLAQVRFRVEDVSADGAVRRSQDKVVMIEFSFVQMNLTIEERYVNPLGFQVYSYKVDEETVR